MTLESEIAHSSLIIFLIEAQQHKYSWAELRPINLLGVQTVLDSIPLDRTRTYSYSYSYSDQKAYKR